MTTTELPKLKSGLAPDPSEPDRSWFGYLTAENVEHVAATFAALLGGRSFTTTTAYEYRRWEPVRAPTWTRTATATGVRRTCRRTSPRRGTRTGRRRS